MSVRRADGSNALEDNDGPPSRAGAFLFRESVAGQGIASLRAVPAERVTRSLTAFAGPGAEPHGTWGTCERLERPCSASPLEHESGRTRRRTPGLARQRARTMPLPACASLGGSTRLSTRPPTRPGVAMDGVCAAPPVATRIGLAKVAQLGLSLRPQTVLAVEC